MSEVKVRITAQNETQTGFQSVLSDAKKTASEVKKTFADSSAPRAIQSQQAGGGKPFSFKDFYDDAINKAEQQIEANLAKRKQAREAATQAEKAASAESGNSIMGLVGRFALLAGAAVSVGKVISLAFQEVSNAFKQAAETSKQLGAALQQAGSAMSSGGAVSGFKQINALAEQFEKTRKETFGDNFGEALANAAQGRPGQLGARLADLALTPFGMSGSADLSAQAENARRQAREMLVGSLARQATNAQDLLGAGGDSEAIRRMQTAQQNAAEIDQARQTLDPTGNGNEVARQAIELIKERQAAEAALAEQIKQTAAAERQAAADKAAANRADEMRVANQQRAATSGMTDEQLLAFERQKLESLNTRAAEFGGLNTDEQERQQIAANILAIEERIKRTREQAVQSAKDTADARAFDAMSPAERQAELDRQMAEFQSGLASGALTPQAASEQAARLMQMFDATNQAPAGFQGSAGASAFQRIGFATNEFFDTRKTENPTKAAQKAASFAEKIYQAISKGDPLVLNPSNS